MVRKFLPGRLIKLDATSSTNDFLREMSADQPIENFTAVTAEMQTAGRGQMGAEWRAEKGKNLMFSILIRDILTDAQHMFILNAAVALSVVDALATLPVPELSIKWPNDIMSGNKKIGGILIENTIKSSGAIVSIAGIGLNINQSDFQNLPQASSLKVVTGREFDRHAILKAIIENIISNSRKLLEDKGEIWDEYFSRLFKKDKPMPFEDENGRFMGMIHDVSPEGKLVLRLEDDSFKSFGIREIKMLY